MNIPVWHRGILDDVQDLHEFMSDLLRNTTRVPNVTVVPLELQIASVLLNLTADRAWVSTSEAISHVRRHLPLRQRHARRLTKKTLRRLQKDGRIIAVRMENAAWPHWLWGS